MKQIAWLTLLSILLLPGAAKGDDQKTTTNVNSRYDVESASIAGVADSMVSDALRHDMQKLVGVKYDPEKAEALADRMRAELKGYSVTIKVTRGERSDHVKVVFQAERRWEKKFAIAVPWAVYHSKEGFSFDLTFDGEIHHNAFIFGWLNSTDQLVERNSGVRWRYEHRKVGTDRVQVGIEFDQYHPTFKPETQTALAFAPDVPGLYRTRDNFAPSVSVIPLPDVKITFGGSFETLHSLYPPPDSQAAHAVTLDVQIRHHVKTANGLRYDFRADYGLRRATTALGSDYEYWRHSVATRLAVSKGHHLFGADFQAGTITGTAPMFERFVLGNSTTLRGWNKLDIDPVGGARVVHGSLEYRYRPFQIFYDVGAVWDPGQAHAARHSVGFGLMTKDGFFASLAFPVRLHEVSPVFMIGFRY
jgi:hypothetical protein